MNWEFLNPVTQELEYQDVDVTCYKYGTWNIVRGPLKIPGIKQNMI
jgi:hypothetical protein